MKRPNEPLLPLTDEDRATYEWQMWVPDFGEEGQRKLKSASVLISRIGGVGGLVAYELAAAGVGRLILAHAGDLKTSDLNRQILMRHEAIGASRIVCAAETLRALNPNVQILAIPENINSGNVERLVAEADVVVSCAPLFAERYLMNEQAVRQRKPYIDCAMYELTGQIATTIPGHSACLACRVASPPEDWSRRFPVFGAVAATAGCIGAMEAIKVISGIGEPLTNKLLSFDLRDMRFRVFKVQRRRDCPVCSNLNDSP